MKFIVGSKSVRKIEIVKKVAEEIVEQDIEVEGIAAESQVPETPWNEQTHEGARNRALFCLNHNLKANYFVGLESGLVERYGHVYEEAWTVIVTQNDEEFAGYSSGLKVPDFILQEMEKNNISHHEVMNMLERKKPVSLKHETWGNYTGGILLRETSLAESIRNAMLQIFSSENSWYKQ